MKVNYSIQKIKYLCGFVLVGTFLLIGFGMSASPIAHAQGAWTETPAQLTLPLETPSPVPGGSSTAEPTSASPTQAPAPTSTSESSDYYSLNALSIPDGTIIDQMIIHGPPVPPPGYEMQLQAVPLPEILSSAGTNILTVPAYPWVYGCSAVSGAMIAGFYDRNGYPNMYTGPTDGGVMPLVDKSSWGTFVDVPPSPSRILHLLQQPLGGFQAWFGWQDHPRFN